MIIGLASSVRNARSTVFLNAMNDGMMVFYDGAMPSPGDAVTTQNIIGIIDLNTPCGDVTDGVFSVAAGLEGQVTTGGTTTWVRILNSADEWVMDLDVGDPSSGAAVILPATVLYEGAFIRVSHFSLTEP